MQKYKCHKVVEAGVIFSVHIPINKKDRHIVCVVPQHARQGLADVTVQPEFFSRGVPGKGDYLVRYEPTPEHPEGYLSWSPKAVFEAGYSLLED